MKIYDPTRKCIKCGGDDVSTTWMQDNSNYTNCYRVNHVDAEHMDRRCRRCGYEWAEACLDADSVALLSEDLALDAGVPCVATIIDDDIPF